MELPDALSQISAIRAQIERTETFRGYRSFTVGFSGVLGIVGGVAQTFLIPNPVQQISAYLTLWITIAAISLMVVGIELTMRCYLAVSPRTTRLTLLAVEQFLPCVVVGALLTAVLTSASEETLWILPGLWAIIFSLGVFASYRLLPKQSFWIGVFYLATGLFCLSLGNGPRPLAPWMMAGTFGVGQLLTAGILYWTLERRHGQS